MNKTDLVHHEHHTLDEPEARKEAIVKTLTEIGAMVKEAPKIRAILCQIVTESELRPDDPPNFNRVNVTQHIVGQQEDLQRAVGVLLEHSGKELGISSDVLNAGPIGMAVAMMALIAKARGDLDNTEPTMKESPPAGGTKH